MARGLEHALEADRAIRSAATRLKDDTLILFTADYSCDFPANVTDPDAGLIMLAKKCWWPRTGRERNASVASFRTPTFFTS